MSPALLVLDIGNTNTSAGLWSRGRIVRQAALGKPGPRAAVTALRGLVGDRPLRGACLCSVVPAENAGWARVLRRHWGVESLVLDARTDWGLPIRYPRPETIGADRLANAVAAARRHGTPVIVADFGTALTFDIVTRAEGYVGGVIAPGLPLMFDYLAEKTALLPHISPAPVDSPIGRSTEEAMRAGAHYGYRGMVREILAALRREPALRRAVVCATGGYAAWVMEALDPAVPVHPDLTLTGTALVWERQQADRRRP
jgi:type III pantothenate kinase